jgi:pilus assembly protein CpaD
MKTNIMEIAFITLSLTACESVENFKNVHHAKEPIVTKVGNQIDVSFEYASSHIDEDQINKLDQFIMKNEISRQDDLVISIAEQGGQTGQLRAEKIAAYFRHMGLKPTLKYTSISDNLQNVQINLERYVVSVPNCPDWSKKPNTDYNNQPSSNFGCAQAANLALMIGNPKDLIVGRESSLADGVYLSNTIQSYRAAPSQSQSTQSASGGN